MSLKRKLLGNGIAVGIQKIVRVFDQILLVPFFISAWGVAYYGEWITLTIIPSIIALSDFGFGTAAANSFVLKYASGDKAAASNISKTGFFVITIMILFGLIISFVTLLVLQHSGVFTKSLIKSHDAIWAISILIATRLITFYTQLYEAYFRAARKSAQSINWLTASDFLSVFGGIIILLFHQGVIAFACSQLVISLIFNFFYIRKAKSLLYCKEMTNGVIKKSDIRQISAKGFGYLMSPIWQSVYFQGTTFVVRIVLGAEAVATFNTIRTATRSVNQIINMIDAAVFPEMLFEIGQGNLKKVRKLYGMSIWAALIIAIVGISLLYFFGVYFYNIWTQNNLQVPKFVWNIFLSGILLNALWWTGGVVFRALNKPYHFAIMGLCASIISVLLSYYLSKKLGLLGAAFGSLSLDFLMALYIIPVSSKLLGVSATEMLCNGGKDIAILVRGVFRKSYKPTL